MITLTTPRARRGAPCRLFTLLASLILLPAAFDSRAQALSVSDGGAPVYSMPIAVPPGIAGMSPNLSLTYSGAGLNGPVGNGWSLQGVSIITRCPNIRSVDGAVRNVDYTAADKLCLDGQRLVQTDAGGTVSPFPQSNDSLGLASGDVREYRTEKDTFVRVRAYGAAGGVAGNGPAWFRVWTKAGQIYEYGNNANAAANAAIGVQNQSVVAAWAVSRISDTLGNYIDFFYGQRDVAWGSNPFTGAVPGHEWNLLEVQYTGRGTQLPVNKVVLEYEDRASPANVAQDASETYHLGSKNVSLQRLKAIRTYVGSLKVRTTQLSYDNGPVTNRSRLVQIVECAGAAEAVCLPPVRFSYSSGGGYSFQPSGNFPAALATSALIDLQGARGVITGDFFGQGRQDILRWADNPAENQLWRNTGDGGFSQVPAGGGAGQFNLTDHNLFKSDSCYFTVVADLDGDGLTDLFRYSAAASLEGAACDFGSGQPDAGQAVLYLSKGDGSFTRVAYNGPALNRSKGVTLTPTAAQIKEGGHTGWTSARNFLLFDVDGDGRLDVVTTLRPAYNVMADAEDPCRTVVCTQIWLGDGNGNFTSRSTNLANHSLYTTPAAGSGIGQPKNVADANGDGLADVVRLNDPFHGPSVYLSNGNGDFTASSGGGCDYPLDFNGDGRADCLAPAFDGTAGNNSLAVSTGAGYGAVAGFNLKTASQELSSVPGQPVTTGVSIADFNGDGRSDILRWKDSSIDNALYLSNGDGTFKRSDGFVLGSTIYAQLKKSDGTADYQLGDFTGHGATEILSMVTNPSAGGATNRLFARADALPPDQLLTVTSPTGLVTRVTYVPLTNSASGTGGFNYPFPRYTSARVPGGAAIYPKQDITPPMQVVATLESDTGVTVGGVATTVKTEYAYQGLRVDMQGRGLLGFMQMSQQQTAPNGEPLTVVTSYLHDHPYTGLASTTATYRGALGQAGVMLSRTSNAYCDKTSSVTTPAGIVTPGAPPAPCATSAKLQKPYLLESFEEGWDVGQGIALPTVRTSNTYDQTGNTLTVLTQTAGTAADSIPQISTKLVTNTYYVDDIAGEHWILGRLQRATVRNQVPNSLGQVAVSAGSAPNATSTTLPVTALSASPASVSAVSTAPAAASASVAITNNSGAAQTVSLSLTGGGSLSVTSLACPASGACGNVVITSPTALGAYSGELVVTPASGATPLLVPVSLTVRTATNVVALPAALSVSTITPTPAGGTVLLRNTGQTPTTLGLSVSGGASVSPTSLNCPANDDCGTVQITTPTAAGAYSGSLTLASSAGGSAASVPLALTVLTAPNVSAAPGAVTASSTAPLAATGVVSFSNSGQTATTLALAATGGSSLSVATLSCPANGSCGSVGISSPTVAGTYNGSLTATSSYNGSVTTVPLNLSVLTPVGLFATPSPNPLTVTTTTPAIASGTVTFGNAGQTPTTLTLSVTGGASLSTTSLSCPGAGTCGTVTVSSPSVAGNYSGTLTASSSAGGAPVTVPVALVVRTQPSISASTAPSPLSVSTTTPTAASGTVTLTNGGQTPTTLSLALTGGGSLSTSSLSCPAGGSCGTVSITSPSAAGNYAGTLTMVSSAGGSVASVPVSMIVLTAPSIAAVSSPSPLSLTVSQPAVASGSVSFTNSGQTPTTLSLSVNGGLSLSSTSLNCPASGSCGSVSVSSGSAAGTYAGTLTVGSSAGGSVTSVPVNFTVLTPPSVSPSTGQLSSATTSPTPASGTVSFSNGGQTPTTLSLSVSGGSSLSASTLNCPASGSCGSVTVTSPTAPGTYNGTLSVASSAGGSAGGVGIGFSVASPPSISVAPTSQAFGLVFDSQTSVHTLTVTNAGGAGTMSVAFSGSNSKQYTVQSGGTCTPGGQMAGNSSCTLMVVQTGILICGSSPGTVPLSATMTVTVGASAASAALSGTNNRGKTGQGVCG